MGYDTQIQAKGKGSIKLDRGVFKNVLYVSSLEENLLYVYQMTHTGSPKKILFGLESMKKESYFENPSFNACHLS